MFNSLPTQILLKGMQPLEPFRGSEAQDVLSWLIDLDELFDAAKQKPEERLSIVPTYLAGDAKQWYRLNGPYDSWPEFKNALGTAFTSSAHHLTNSAQLYNRRQALNESVQTYYFDVMRLCSRLNPDMPTNERLLHLLRGLKPSLAQTLIMLNPQTCSELLEQGKRAEAASILSQSTASSPTVADTDNHETVAAIPSTPNTRSRAGPTDPQQSHVRSPSPSDLDRYLPPASRRSPNSRTPGLSYHRQPHHSDYSDPSYRRPSVPTSRPPRTDYSNQYSMPSPSTHTPRPSYSIRRPQSHSRPTIKCYTCGGLGHRARDCPTPRDHLNF